MKNRAFTLVELLVVIWLLAILSTIWIISYSWYSSSTRDTNRITQLNEIYNWLNAYVFKQKRVLPDSKIDIFSWWKIISYQWYVWKKILWSIKYSADWIDPKDWTFFSLYMTKNKKYFQLLAFLEESDKVWILLWRTNAIDYSKRIPYIKWSNLWILVNEYNIPIQEITSIKDDQKLDIDNVWNTVYKSFVRNSRDILSGTWTIFATPLKKFAEMWGKFCESTNLTCDKDN